MKINNSYIHFKGTTIAPYYALYNRAGEYIFTSSKRDIMVYIECKADSYVAYPRKTCRHRANYAYKVSHLYTHDTVSIYDKTVFGESNIVGELDIPHASDKNCTLSIATPYNRRWLKNMKSRVIQLKHNLFLDSIANLSGKFVEVFTLDRDEHIVERGVKL